VLNMTFSLKLDGLRLEWKDFQEEGMRIEIFGQSGTGKSHAVKVILEEFVKYAIPFFVIDPEGEYVSFKQIAPTLIVGGKFADIPLNKRIFKQIIELLFLENFSIVFDISELIGIEKREEIAAAIQKQIFDYSTRYRKLFVFVIDETKLIAPQYKKLESNFIASDIAQRGRKRGIIPIFSMQRPSEVDKSVITQCNIHFMGKLQFPTDLNYVKDLLRDAQISMEDIKQLTREFYFWTGGTAKKIKFRELRILDLGKTVQPGEKIKLTFQNDINIEQAKRRILKNLNKIMIEKREKLTQIEKLKKELEKKKQIIHDLEKKLEEERNFTKIIEKINFLDKKKENIAQIDKLKEEIENLKQVIYTTSKRAKFNENIENYKEFEIFKEYDPKKLIVINSIAIDKENGSIIANEPIMKFLNMLTPLERKIYFKIKNNDNWTINKISKELPGIGLIKVKPAIKNLIKHGFLKRRKKGKLIHYGAVYNIL